MARLLGLRREHPRLFEQGAYVPLDIRGSRAAHVLAYARHHRGHRLVVIVGRLFAKLLVAPGWPQSGEAVWGDTRVDGAGLADEDQLVNCLTGESVTLDSGGIRLSQALASFPAAVFFIDQNGKNRGNRKA